MLYVTTLDITGYKAEYSTLDDFTTEGTVVTAYMNDGSSKLVATEDVEFSGYIQTAGTWTITAVYGGAMKMFSVKVRAATDEEKAQKVSAMITALPEVTLDSEDAITAVRQAYDGLTDVQKELVSNYAQLTAAEDTLLQLKVDTQAAEAATQAIVAIGTVTKDSGDAIQAARTAYDGLTEAQKQLVTEDVLKTLTDAETAFEKLTQLEGWITEDGYQFYYVNGKKATGFTAIEGKTYYFSKVKAREGRMMTGFQTIGGYRYFFSKVKAREG